MKKVRGGGNKFSSLPPKMDTPVNQPSIAPPSDNERTIELAYNAIIKNDLASLKTLNIKNGDIVFYDHKDEVAVNLAIQQNNIEMVEYLFDKGAIPIYPGGDYADPLEASLTKKKGYEREVNVNADIAMVKVILDRLTSPLTDIQKQNIEEAGFLKHNNWDKDYSNEEKYTIEVKNAILNGFLNACKTGRIDIIKLFLERDLIDLRNENKSRAVLMYILINLEYYRELIIDKLDKKQKVPDEIARRDKLYKVLEYILQQGAIENVAMTEEGTGHGWNEDTQDYSTPTTYIHQPIIYQIIKSRDPKVAEIFMQNGLKVDDIMSYDTGGDEELAEHKTNIIKRMNEIMNEENRKKTQKIRETIPEILSKMREQVGDQVDPALAREIGNYIGGRKTHRSKKSYKKKKRSKKITTRKRR